jgi:hypothetical protein
MLKKYILLNMCNYAYINFTFLQLLGKREFNKIFNILVNLIK